MFGCQEAWGNGTMHSGKRTYVVTWWRGLRASRCVALALASGFRNFEHFSYFYRNAFPNTFPPYMIVFTPYIIVFTPLFQNLFPLSPFSKSFDMQAGREVD